MKIAGVYGDSLYELAVEEELTDVIMQQMQEVLQLFRENPEYTKLLGEPSIPKKERIGMIEEAFAPQAERYLINFMKLLCERGILNEFSGCYDEFVRRYNADNGIAEAVVTSAVALSKDQAAALKKRLETISGKKIFLIQRLDASVLAGLRVELEGKLLDGTVKGRLSGISRKLEEIIV